MRPSYEEAAKIALEKRKPALDALMAERAELNQKYTDAKTTKGTPDWVVSARKAEAHFAFSVLQAFPNFIFNDEELAEIAKRKNFIHLCWVEWNTYGQKDKYAKGHDVNIIEDIMDVVCDTITLPNLSKEKDG